MNNVLKILKIICIRKFCHEIVIISTNAVAKRLGRRMGAAHRKRTRVGPNCRDLAIGNWNVSSLTGKEQELVCEAQQYRLDVVGISSTKRRGSGTVELNDGWKSAVMRQLHRSVVLKRELCTKAKLSIFRSVYVPILTYGHECWIMNEKVRSRVQAAEMGFLRRISGLTLLDKVKSADIREFLNIESLLLRLERSQLRWYGHVTRMPQERTAKKLLCSTPIGRRPRGRPRTRWRDYVEDLSWSRLGIPAEHLSFVAEDRDAWRLQLELLPPRPPKDKRVQKIDWLIVIICWQSRYRQVCRIKKTVQLILLHKVTASCWPAQVRAKVV